MLRIGKCSFSIYICLNKDISLNNISRFQAGFQEVCVWGGGGGGGDDKGYPFLARK